MEDQLTFHGIQDGCTALENKQNGENIMIGILIVVVILAALPFITALSKSCGRMRELSRRIDLHTMKLMESEARLAGIQALAEAKLAEASNKVVKGDLEIELLKLKITREEQKLGINGETLNPENYNSDPTAE